MLRSLHKDKELTNFGIVAMDMLAGQWILFLTGFYMTLPYAAAEKIFIAAWSASAVAGFSGALHEWRNNRSFSRLLLMLSVLNSLFAWAAHGLGNM